MTVDVEPAQDRLDDAGHGTVALDAEGEIGVAVLRNAEIQQFVDLSVNPSTRLFHAHSHRRLFIKKSEEKNPSKTSKIFEIVKILWNCKKDHFKILKYPL